MFRHSLRPHYLMGGLVALLLAITAAAGLLVKDIYQPFMSEGLVAAQFIQDIVSLLCAPLLVAAMIYTGRGSARAFVLWVGLLVYTIYYYAFYAFDHVVTVVYPLYIALIGLGVYSLIGLLVSVDLAAFGKRVSSRMPVRFIAVVLGMTLLFVPLWLGMMAQDIQAQQARPTATVFVLDLAFLIPVCTYAAIQIWRRRPLGYLLGGILLIKATASGLLLSLTTLRVWQLGHRLAVEELGMYLFLAVAGLVALVLYMRNVDGPKGTQDDGQNR